jgi:flagellar motor switch protein FliM
LNKLLSSQEMDSLLSALNSGQLDSQDKKVKDEKSKVRAYDFRRPIKLSKEYISTLYMIFENFSKIAGNMVSNLTHTNVDIKIGAIEQVSFDEFMHSIPNPTLLGLFRCKQLKGTQIIEMHPRSCVQIIDLMLGGLDSSYNNLVKDKEIFTDIELGVIEDVVLRLLKAFEMSWGEIIHLDTELENLQTNPQLTQNISPNELIILTSFIIEVMGNSGFMHICIPYISFEGITDKLSIKSWFDVDKENVEKNRENLEGNIQSVEVDLEVVLGKAVTTVGDFLQLEAGDIIQLNRRIDEPLEMYVEDKLHFYVKPGEVDDKLAVEILKYI